MMSQNCQLLLLLLLAMLAPSAIGELRIGVTDKATLQHLVATVSDANFTLINATADAGDNFTAIKDFIKLLSAENPQVLVGEFTTAAAAASVEMNLTFYCTTDTAALPVANDDVYIGNSKLILMNNFNQDMIVAANQLTKSEFGRTIITLINDVNATQAQQQFLNTITDITIHHIEVTDVDNTTELMSDLFSVKSTAQKSETVYCLLTSSPDTVNAVLQSASMLSMMNNKTVWMVLDFFNNSAIQQYYRTGAQILQFNQNSVNTSFQLQMQLAVESVLHFASAMAANGANVTLQEILQHKFIGNFDTWQFNLSTRSNNEAVMNVWLGHIDSQTAVWFGSWNKCNSQITRNPNVTFAVLPHIRVVAALEEPFVMRSKTNNNNNNRDAQILTGFCINLLEQMSTDLFTYELQLVKLGDMLDMVRNGTSDLIANLIQVANDHDFNSDKSLSFSELPVTHSGIAALGQAAQKEDELLSSLFPLSWNVWFAIAIAYVVLSTTLYCTDKISPNDYKKPRFTVSRSAFFVLASFMMSKLHSTAVKPSARIFILILWFASLMYCTTYGTNYFFMTIRLNQDLPFDSLAGLYARKDYYYWMVIPPSPEGRRLESQGRDTVYWKLRDEAEPVLHFPVALGRVMNGTVDAAGRKPIFVGNELSISYLVSAQCSLRQAGKDELRERLHLAMSSKTLTPQFRRSLNHRLQLLTDQGKLDQIKEFYWNQENCLTTENLMTSVNGVTVKQVAGIFIILGCGLILSFVVLGLEHAIHVIKLVWQRFQTDPKFSFNEKYLGKVTTVSPSGVRVFVKDSNIYIPNALLSPDPTNVMSAADLQIQQNSQITVVYLGHDTEGANYIFKRVG